MNNSNLIVPLTLILIFFLTLGVIGVLFFFPSESTDEQGPADSFASSTFPQPPSDESFDATAFSEPTVVTQSGRQVEVPGLLSGDDVELIDPSGGVYQISGEAGFDTPIYEIFYYENSGTITVTLLTEDLQFARGRAEAYLRERLNVQNQFAFCSYEIRVVVPRNISQSYSGQNLGFPPCPEAVQLQDQ